MKKADLLKQALEIVEKRGLSYGTPENNFERIAQLWTTYFALRENRNREGDFIVNETDVAALMVLMKVARLMEKPDHLDSWLDIAGYAACGAEVSRAGEVDEDLGEMDDSGAVEDLFSTAAREFSEALRDAPVTGTGAVKTHVTPEGKAVMEVVHLTDLFPDQFKIGSRVVRKADAAQYGTDAEVGVIRAWGTEQGWVLVNWEIVGCMGAQLKKLQLAP